MSHSNTFSKAILALMVCSLLCVVSEIEVKKKYPHPAVGLTLSKAEEFTSTLSPSDISPDDSSTWNWIIVIGVLIVLVAIVGLCAACGMLEKCRAYISQCVMSAIQVATCQEESRLCFVCNRRRGRAAVYRAQADETNPAFSHLMCKTCVKKIYPLLFLEMHLGAVKVKIEEETRSGVPTYTGVATFGEEDDETTFVGPAQPSKKKARTKLITAVLKHYQLID
ncbi:hypothetical protein DdX_10360 [Ditylenchus destructor]|uniref:Uncharacterized protein n=1 Tax=Ditylenchus destructor TaxID=166010 RepID=A0AAD4N076_9BILA|nr:hypothetical protein DdX_10360 [Ditylenchus destructor]